MAAKQRFHQSRPSHVRGVHDVTWEIKLASLEQYLPPWTVTRKVWSDSLIAQHSGILTAIYRNALTNIIANNIIM